MSRIFIFNFERSSQRAVSRHLWMVDEDDIVVSPLPVDVEHFEYVGRMLGFDTSRVSVVAADQLLTDELLAGDPTVTDRLAKLLPQSPFWEVVPCLHTVGVAELALRLGIPHDDALRFAAQRGPELLNRKSHFRQLAVGARVPVPCGSVVVSTATLAKALERHLPATGTVIVKRDDANGGRGNITVTTGAAVPMPGSRETRQVEDDLDTMAATLWQALTDDRSRTLVVEVYHEAIYCFYFEFLIDDRGCPELLGSGSFRRRPDTDPSAPGLFWTGLDLPAEIPAFAATDAVTLTTRIVNLAAQVGYRGYINVDAILTPTEEIFVNEINARWGGGLALDILGRRLMGKRYADGHVMASIRDIPSMSLANALRIFTAHGLQYSPETQEGVVVVGHDPSLENTMECVAVAADRDRLRELERNFRQAVAKETR